MRLLHRWGLPSLVATLCFAVFIPSLDGQFLNWDDQVNPEIGRFRIVFDVPKPVILEALAELG
ncbi:MAG: hypothetical protein Q7W02_09835 [Candidatus Rokubacteria bacterium]|nr:hypothetical protein [Candidatus Rokubacteria bacterium]